MIDLDWGLETEERVKLVERHLKDYPVDFNDKNTLNLLADYLTGDIISNHGVQVERLDRVKSNKIRYITKKVARAKYGKEARKRAYSVKHFKDYLKLRTSLRKLKAKDKDWVRDRLDRLREQTNEPISTEKQFFKTLNDDINYCMYRPDHLIGGKNTVYVTESIKFTIDYTDEVHMRTLLRNYNKLVGSKTLISIKYDLAEMIKKVNMTNREYVNLMDYMDGVNTKNINRSLVKCAIEKIVKYNKGENHG